MNVIKCKKGHFFDGDLYSICPHCGETAMIGGSAASVKGEKKGFWGRGRKGKEAEVQPVSRTPSATPRNNFESGNTPTDVIEKGAAESISTPPLKKNPTLDFWQTASHTDDRIEEIVDHKGDEDSKVGRIEEKFDIRIESGHMPVADQYEVKTEEVKREESKTSEYSSSLREAVKKSSASNEGKTMSYFSFASGNVSDQIIPRSSVEPVVGWLVCVGGCHFGECFSIYAGKNSLGRSDENRIIIANDNSISRIKHAFIVYEPKKREFYLQPGDSSGLTYLNNDYITDSHKLMSHDMIEIGDSKFIFAPLCGEAFSWEDHMPKGE